MGISANQARLLTLTARQHDLELRAQQISARKMVLAMNSQQKALEYSNGLNAWSKANQLTAVTRYSDGSAYSNYIVKNASGDVLDISSLTGEEIKAQFDSLHFFQTKTVTRPYNVETDSLESVSNSAKQKAMASVFSPTGTTSRGDSAYDWLTETGAYYNFSFAGIDTTEINGETVYYVNFNVEGIQAMGYPWFKDDDGIASNTIEAASSEIYWKNDYATEGYVTEDQLKAALVATGAQVTEADQEVEVTNMQPLTYTEYVNNNDGSIDIDTIKAEYDSAMKELSSLEKLLDMELTQINTEHNAVKTEYDSVKSLVSDNTEKSFNVFG